MLAAVSADGPTNEARQLTRLYQGQAHLLVGYLSSQLAVVKGQAQNLVGLCGLAITVTGFSGAHMIRAGSTAAASMVLGIALILVGLLVCLATLSQIHWVSQDLEDDLAVTVARVIERRDRHQRRVMLAAIFVAAGLSAYLGAVVIAALLSGNVRPG
jgi:hypothetical protein